VPSVPANSIALAEVAVAAGALSITTGNITDRRVLVTTNIPETGDISAVVAGTGLSGGGTSGSVTLAINTAVTADLTTAQTLTNKTLTTPTLTSPLINVGINAQTGTSYTTVLADNGKLVTQTNASAITTTIPPNSSVAYPVGAQLNVAQFGAGQVSFAQGAGVTIVSTGATASAPQLRAQYSTATAIQTATDTWLVIGDIS
jgi:hypothetical protein